ncbi:MAG: iron ABC transporter ATP-binding protein [Phycisphaeraceae bacterium]|nr:iron ABC transporter ATP-binding protein [Phycisphaeraceae bacterium]
MKPLLTVENLSKKFVADGPPIIDRASFEVDHNELFVLVGPSGCGKTTMLRLIAGFERVDAGMITLDGACIESSDRRERPERRGVGFVFQDYALFPHLSVMRNVCFGLRRGSRADRERRARDVLKMVDMIDMADRTPHALSGGQQQRVALARSIAPAPRLVLLDEPFSNVDAAMRQTMRQDVRRLLRRNRTAAILVTHDQEEALSFADRLGVMREGRIEQIGAPAAVYQAPRTAFVARFLGRTNLMPADASGKRASCALGQVRLCCRAQGPVTISIRPEHLKFEHLYPGERSGQIIRRQFKGHDLAYTVVFADQEIEVHADYACAFEVGQSVRVVATEPAVIVEDEGRGSRVEGLRSGV